MVTNIAIESPGSWGGTPRTASNQYIQDRIDAGAPGTTYRLLAGIHRGQNIELATGDTLIINTGAIVNGSEDVGTSGWADEGGGVWSKAVVKPCTTGRGAFLIWM